MIGAWPDVIHSIVRRWRFVTVGIALVCALSFLGGPTLPVHANPFESLSKDHFAYNAVRRLSGYELGKAYVEDRVRIGEPITHFDLAMWVGAVLDRLTELSTPVEGIERAPDSIADLVQHYNALFPDKPIDVSAAQALVEATIYIADHLHVLGYSLPKEAQKARGWNESSAGIARAFETFRLRGESRLHFVDVDVRPAAGEDGDAEHSSELRQSHRIQIVSPITEEINLGAEIEGGGSLITAEGQRFALQSAALDIVFAQSGVARVGHVSGRGISQLAIADVESLSGVRAGLRLGDVGSTLLLGRYTSDGTGDDASPAVGMVTAWDGLVEVSPRLRVGATLAHAESERSGETSETEGTVFRVGGVYTISPQLTLSGELARSAHDGGNRGGGALKVGAVLHPLPEMSFGAFLLSATSGYRPLLAQDDEPMARLDLSAEVGRWILSLRRLQRSGSEANGSTSITGDGDSTTLDLEVHFDRGKVSLGYTLENVKDVEVNRPVRTTSASLEHAVGPVGRARAGFSIMELEEGSEISSNLGLRYDFEDASLSLQYEIFNKLGDIRENVTTAEVSIKF